MIQLTDFNKICRICLSKRGNQMVDLFKKHKITENRKEMFIFETVESFCSVKIRNGDGLPGSICYQCWDIVSQAQKLRILSLKSDRRLNRILNSDDSDDTAGAINQLEKDFKIEFIDTTTNVENEITEPSDTNCWVENMTMEGQSIKIEEANDEEDIKTNARDEYPCSELSESDLKTEQSDIVACDNEIKTVKKGRRNKFGVKKISCEICGKLVPSSDIEFHLNVHKGLRPYKCQLNECEKYFVSPALARSHFKKVHIYGITRPCKCDVCGAGFIQKSSLDLHRSYHFDPEIPCTICGKLFRNTRALKKHSLVHSGERNFPCSECKKSFQTRFTLRIHMRTHTQEKPFICAECPKTFAYKCLLKAHITKYHVK
ncbi:Gastrula zinc finger protein xFG20-1 [Pseudolycoriella hygida]|uniref:Gastrula zinc finger protein xFG20-1 n=1 Tax=Pseudolycoriella hygida TaxID=35572 RepID=A0A9Q0RUB4_9DIPT|nr:Gastrula zinc finger protein xFG20-1 [Pseudolycoriella hygida]